MGSFWFGWDLILTAYGTSKATQRTRERKSKSPADKAKFPNNYKLEALEDRVTPALNFLGIDEQQFNDAFASAIQPNQIVFLGAGLSPEQLQVRIPTSRNAADTTNTDDLWTGGSLGLNLAGTGYSVGVWEAGGGLVRYTHQEFNGRVTHGTEWNGTDVGSQSGHATNVAGVIGSTGIDAAAHGMANNITMVNYTANFDTQEMNRDANSYVVSNHSYSFINGWYQGNGQDVGLGNFNTDIWFGDRFLYGVEAEGFGKYDQNAVDVDTVISNNPTLLSVWSAGNDRGDSYTNRRGNGTYVTYLSGAPSGFVGFTSAGWYVVNNSGSTAAPTIDGGANGFDSVSQSQTAKNTLVVGAIDDITVDPYTNANVSIASFSGFGPTDDGRMKPDIVGNGISVYTAGSGSNTSYVTTSGTSFSSPNVAGSAALLVEHYHNTFGINPFAATTKAIILHSAFDANNVGPDYRTGWGVMDSKAAAQIITSAQGINNNDHIYEMTYGGTEIVMPYSSTGAGKLWATIVWTDLPGTATDDVSEDLGTAKLVHDLDIWFEGPTGTTYYPWTLDPSNPSANAVRTVANHRDNVEQVMIDAPSAGIYKLHVGRTGSTFNQNFSLVVSGAKSAIPPTVTVSGLTANFVENGAPLILESTATVADVDSPNFNGGSLTVSFTANGTASDRLSVRNQGTANGQIGVAGTNVTYNSGAGALIIGTLSGGTDGSTPLVIALNANATPTALTALAKNITFQNVSDAPSTLNRTVQWTLNDGTLGVSNPVTTTVSVTAVNDAPVNTVPAGTLNATEDTDFFVTGISVSDIDAGAGNVKVTFSASNSVLTINTAVVGGVSAGQVTGNGTAAVVVTGTQSQINTTLASASGLKYRGLLNFNGTVSLMVLTDDQGNTGTPGPQQDSDTISINVQAVNDAPTINVPGGPTNYSENGLPLLFVNTATLADVDLLDFNTGTLTATFSAGGQAEDRLSIRNEGTGAGQVGVSGGNITFGGVSIGSFVGGTNGSTPLVATFNANSTAAAVQAVLRNITYANISDTPNTTDRVIQFTVTDGDGGTGGPVSTTVKVIAVNDAPVNTVPAGTLIATEDTDFFVTGISVADVDVGAGNLSVTLSVPSGVLTVSTVVGGGVTAGQITGNGTNSVIVSATPAQINATLANASGLKFRGILNFNGNISLNVLTNDLGNTGSPGALQDSDNVTINVQPVNDPPTINVPAGPINYSENSGAVVFTTGATLADVDLLDFNTGILTAAFSSGGQAEDRLSIRNEGNGAGQVGVSGSNVLFGGVTIGSFVGGTNGSTPLVVTFNASSTATSVQAVLRNITYLNVSDLPNENDRVVQFSVTDGDGGSAGPVATTIKVTGMNDAPVNSLPASPATATEDANSAITGLSIADVDIGAGNASVTLSVASGVLTIRADVAGGVTAGQIAGNGTASVVITAPLALINATFADATGIVYHGNLNFNGGDSLTITTNDLGGTGGPGAMQDTDNLVINVAPVNDSPTNTVPGSAIGATEDNSQAITGFSVADIDAGSGAISVTLSVGNGTLNVSTAIAGGVTAGELSNNGTASVTINSTLAKINATLGNAAGVSYLPNLNYNGTDTITILTNDLGNTGGGNLTDSDNVTINIAPVNDAPVNSVPGNQSAIEDTNFVFSTGAGNALSVSDLDVAAGTLEVTLTASNGTLTLASTGGLSFSSGDGTSDGTMTFAGTPAAINAALNGLIYRPAADFFGSANLSLSTNDLGNTGAGGAKADADSISIDVVNVNDNPVVTLASNFGYTEDAGPVAIDTTANVVDVDLTNFDTGTLTVALTANGSSDDRLAIRNQGNGAGQIGISGGTVSFGGTDIGTFVGGTDPSIPLVIMFNANATAASVAALLQNVTFENLSDAPTTAVRTAQVTLTDGDGGASGIHAMSISITQSNDAPVNTLATGALIVDGNMQVTIPGISVADIDAGTQNISVTLSVTNGTLTIATNVSGGVTGGQIVGNNSSSIVLTGTITQINATLAAAGSLKFQADPIFDAGGSLTVTTNDLGNTGTGNALTDTDVVPIEDAPLNPNLVITCTPNADTVAIRPYGGSTTDLTVDVNGVNVGRFRPALGSPLTIDALGGNDTITSAANTGIGFLVHGAGGDDSILGGQGADTIDGGDGNDNLFGGSGNDSLLGGLGNDLAFGQDGNDLFLGSDGNDSCDAGTGNDTVDGGLGNDLVFGQAGADSILGGDGNDNINGGDDNDTVLGEAGIDYIEGGNGNDSLLGGDDPDGFDAGAGNDFVDGGLGNDFMYGFAGNDTLLGQDGADGIDAGDGADLVNAGAGDDFMYGLAGNDTLLGGDGNDGMDGGLDNDSMLGGNGDDLLFGNFGNDYELGGAGNDSIDGNGGNDTLDGSTENDLIFASGGGADCILGGAGDDTLQNIDANATIFAGAGNDFLYGGAFANDSLLGEDGNDTVFALGGNDTITGGAGADVVDGGAGTDVMTDRTAQDQLFNVP